MIFNICHSHEFFLFLSEVLSDEHKLDLFFSTHMNFPGIVLTQRKGLFHTVCMMLIALSLFP